MKLFSKMTAITIVTLVLNGCGLVSGFQQNSAHNLTGTWTGVFYMPDTKAVRLELRQNNDPMEGSNNSWDINGHLSFVDAHLDREVYGSHYDLAFFDAGGMRHLIKLKFWIIENSYLVEGEINKENFAEFKTCKIYKLFGESKSDQIGSCRLSRTYSK